MDEEKCITRLPVPLLNGYELKQITNEKECVNLEYAGGKKVIKNIYSLN